MHKLASTVILQNSLKNEFLSSLSPQNKYQPTMSMTSNPQLDSTEDWYSELKQYLEDRQNEFLLIPEDRQRELRALADYVRECRKRGDTAQLVFICTHNSRRSHLSQIWAQVAAEYYQIPSVQTFSGGTEATAFNPRAVAALIRSGLKITTVDNNADNPRYEVSAGPNRKSQTCFSKVYDAEPNPTHDYCAIMTCSHADEACPFVRGCDLRLPIRYEDPKIGDDTPQESAVYDERSRQICREMLFVMYSV
jgi:arsenate reductase